ncbi:hypothetical protein COL5a_008600 [Colletotrichum fioriniae]|nr:hypothetical protein COL5a_008600 [Colletotrichum fioriniae]
MDPDVCRNCGHSGKHIDFADARCAITERDDAERDKLQADAALARARDICETSLLLMKRQMQELEDANEAIDALRAALAAAEDRRERVRRDLGTHGDVCLLARSNLEAAEEMAISAAGRYFEAGRAVTALEDREQLRKQSPSIHVEEALPLPVTIPMEEDDDAEEEAREKEDRRWKRSNERFCKWLRQSEAQRQIMKSSWTKLRVAERLAGESVNVDVDVDVDAVDDEEDEETARRKRVQAWTAARRLTDQLPPEEDPTMVTEYLESEPTDSAETTEGSSEPLVLAPAPTSAPTSSAHKTGVSKRAPALRTRAKTGRAAATATAPTTQAPQTVPSSPVKGRNLRTARRVESQTRSEPTRPTTATTTATKRVKREPKTTSAVVLGKTGTTTAPSSDGAAAGRPAARTRARTGKTPAAPMVAAAETPAATRPQRATRRRSVRVQPYPQPGAQPRWK